MLVGGHEDFLCLVEQGVRRGSRERHCPEGDRTSLEDHRIGAARIGGQRAVRGGLGRCGVRGV